MALIRLLLLALALGSWASIAGACAEGQDARTSQTAEAQIPMPGPCVQIALHPEHPTCECLTVAVALRSAPGQSEKFVAQGDAGLAPSALLRQRMPARAPRASGLVAAPSIRSPYLITSRLRL